jgi:hypothetical protein
MGYEDVSNDNKRTIKIIPLSHNGEEGLIILKQCSGLVS